MLQTKEDILQGAKASYIRVEDWLHTHPDKKYNQGPEGKWHTSQHIDHLTISLKRLAKGLSAPKFIIRNQFGKPNRPGRNYEEIRTRYTEKLAAVAGGFTNPIEGKSLGPAEKADHVAAYKKAGDRLLKKLAKWEDSDLDKYLLPHPLMGKMTIREIMLWHIYHNEHHLTNLKENY